MFNQVPLKTDFKSWSFYLIRFRAKRNYEKVKTPASYKMQSAVSTNSKLTPPHHALERPSPYSLDVTHRNKFPMSFEPSCINPSTCKSPASHYLVPSYQNRNKFPMSLEPLCIKPPTCKSPAGHCLVRCYQNSAYLFNSSRGFNPTQASFTQRSATPPPSSVGHTQKRHFSSDSFYRVFSPDFYPIKISHDLLVSIHSHTGLPWWASIALATVLLRSAMTLPLSIYSSYILAKVENLQPEIRKLSHRLKIETAKAIQEFGWDLKHARERYNYSMKKVIREVYMQENCHPAKSMVLVWVQLPMWIAVSFTLRYMTGFAPIMDFENPLVETDLSHEGMLWFKDLTLPDPTWILPVTLGIVNLAIIEIHALQRTNSTLLTKIITNLVRGLSILMIPIGASVPSCMCWYWLCSSVYGLSQNLILQLPTIRRAVGIPATPSECDKPYQRLYTAAKDKYTFGRDPK